MRRIMDLVAANAQARQMNEQARELRAMKDSLRNYQSELQRHWQGPEMVHVNRFISDMLQRIGATASACDGLSSDIVEEATAIHKEMLAEAQADLDRAQSNFDSAQQNLNSAQNILSQNVDPTKAPELERRVSEALANLEIARKARDAALAERNRLS